MADKTKGVSGLGGWLFVFMGLTILNVPAALYAMTALLSKYQESSAVAGVELPFLLGLTWAQVIANLVIALVLVWWLTLAFQKKMHSTKFMLVLNKVSLTYALILALTSSYWVHTEGALYFAAEYLALLNATYWGTLLLSVLGFVGVHLYFTKSKRVRNTFIN